LLSYNNFVYYIRPAQSVQKQFYENFDDFGWKSWKCRSGLAIKKRNQRNPTNRNKGNLICEETTNEMFNFEQFNKYRTGILYIRQTSNRYNSRTNSLNYLHSQVILSFRLSCLRTGRISTQVP